MPSAHSAERDAGVHRALSHVARVRIVHLLRDSPHTVSQLAAVLGLHQNTVRGHLDVLVSAGLVAGNPDDRQRRGRPSILYRLTGAVDADADVDAGAHAALAGVLVSALAETTVDPAAAAEQAARPWGRALVAGTVVESPTEAVERVAGELAALGFVPEVQASDDQGRMDVALHRCPFDDLARRDPDIVCAVHLGLLRGALRELGVTVTAELQPFVEPSICLARFTLRGRGVTD